MNKHERIEKVTKVEAILETLKNEKTISTETYDAIITKIRVLYSEIEYLKQIYLETNERGGIAEYVYEDGDNGEKTTIQIQIIKNN